MEFYPSDARPECAPTKPMADPGDETRSPRKTGWLLGAAAMAAAVVGAAVAVIAAGRPGRRTVPEPLAPFLDRAGSLEPRPPEITVPEMFRRTVEQFGEKTAHLIPRDRGWQPLSYAALGEAVRALALGLRDLGIQPGDRVALLSENRSEWAIADLAILGLGAVNVPIYPTLPADQARYLLADCGARALIVSDARQLAKAQEAAAGLNGLQYLIVIEPPATLPAGVLTFAQVQERGRAVPRGEALWRDANAAVRPHDLASIIYTSGTTGNPKGAMLTHYNFTSNAQSVAPLVQIRESDVFLSFLPLSHIFARMADHYFPLLVGATVAYSQGVSSLAREMTEVRPTIMALVPRVYESIQRRVMDAVAKQPPLRRRLFHWALEAGWRHAEARLAGKTPSPSVRAAYRLADRLVLHKVRERTGGRVRYFLSGGAPLPVGVAQFFYSAGMTILEGYGLTETSPVICVNRPERPRLGTVGPPIPGVEIAIAADGEILSRGPHIMIGYYHLPEETAAAIDADGWFHTGDIGIIEADGCLRITDRKKDLIVLANGKNVAPQPIENRLRQSPLIQEAVLFGDRQPIVVALIVPAFDAIRRAAQERGLALPPENEALVEHPEVRRLLRREIDAVNESLADFERVRRFELLPREFTIDAGELTPTLKVKRRVVAERCAPLLAKLFGEGNGSD